MKLLFWLEVICALFVAYWCFFILDNGTSIRDISESYPRQGFSGDKAYRVERVIDGDTITIDYNGKSERVRLIGVDTPETNAKDKDVKRLAERATDFTRNLLDKKRVFLRYDQDTRDRFGRLLAYVYRAPRWSVCQS